jgi:O-antigen/teichoic acid export membrane protein
MDKTRSLGWNTSANYIGRGYTILIGIVILPIYLQYLGAEAFGLIGFFTVLQMWMQLLDMGISPVLSRQAASARGEKITFLELIKLVRSFELIIFVLALIAILTITTSSDWIANNWLNVTSLTLSEVEISIVLMGIMIGLRLFVSLYRSGIQGLENQVWLNIANILLVTIKYLGALLLLQFVTQDFVHFFFYQLAVGVVELIVMAVMFYRFIPSKDRVGIGFFWDTIKPTLPFAGGIAYSAGIWVLITQLDKAILSNILPLSEYGYFSLVVIVAAGVSQIASPISQAILPRMTYLLSQGKEQDMLSLYKQSTQIMAVIMLPLTGMIALYSTELLYAWTGDRKAAEWAGPILFWFVLGNGILAISAFQYYLQFAHGKLKMHVIYNTISASIQIPLIVYVAFEYGVLGVALVWFSIRLISFIVWTPIVHARFAPGIHWSWLSKDIAPILFSTVVLLFIIDSIGFDFDGISRSGIFFILIGSGLTILLANILVSSASRGFVLSVINSKLLKR